MEQSTRSRNTFVVWAGLHFPGRLAAYWPTEPDGPFDWSKTQPGRSYRVLWVHEGRYFYLNLPYYPTQEQAAAGAAGYRVGTGESTAHTPLNSGCWLPLCEGYAALELHYYYTSDLRQPPRLQNAGAAYLNWTRRWRAGDIVQLWTDGSSLMCTVTGSGVKASGAAPDVRLERVEDGGWRL